MCTYVCLLDCHRMIVLLAVVTRLRLYIVSIREANFLSVEMCFFFIFISLKTCLVAQKNRLIVMILLGTRNICIG